MRYKTLGSTGLLVSEICLGTMTFGGKGFWTVVGTLDQTPARLGIAQTHALLGERQCAERLPHRQVVER